MMRRQVECQALHQYKPSLSISIYFMLHLNTMLIHSSSLGKIFIILKLQPALTDVTWNKKEKAATEHLFHSSFSEHFALCHMNKTFIFIEAAFLFYFFGLSHSCALIYYFAIFSFSNVLTLLH